MPLVIGPGADDGLDERPQLGFLAAARVDGADDRQMPPRVQVVNVISEESAGPAFDIFLMGLDHRLLERGGQAFIGSRQHGIGHWSILGGN